MGYIVVAKIISATKTLSNNWKNAYSEPENGGS